MNKGAVVLDFDGTIADAEEAFIAIYKSLVVSYKLPELNRKDYYRIRKGSPRDIMRWSGIKFWQIPRLVRIGRIEYKKHIDSIRLFKNMPKVIKELSKDKDVYILSSNDNKTVKKILKNNKLDAKVTILTASSLFGKDKALKRLLKKHKYSANKSWMIGDEARDIEAGKKARMKTIGVTWGLQGREGIKRSDPDHIATRPEQILYFIARQDN
ncbi:MAG TPA: HAD hydrolase-like protein [Patescibacteria group bacterium]|nr:HAD hydrolase-like protein [Patescibacteria group bacterium]